MRRARHGFSLLEVIIATAILVASSMVLLRLLSVGRQHQVRGETRTIAQIVCQTLVDQWVIDSALRRTTDMEPVPDRPDWTFSAEVEPTEITGLVRVRIRVYPPETSETSNSESFASVTSAEPRAAYQLVRWMRSPQSERPVE
jgi:prepilin-type N-terminal cleavage/methylation domain-containing protein